MGFGLYMSSILDGPRETRGGKMSKVWSTFVSYQKLTGYYGLFSMAVGRDFCSGIVNLGDRLVFEGFVRELGCC